MTFDAKEKSATGGSPTEWYLFTSGSSAWRYTSADGLIIYGGYDYLPTWIARGEIQQSQEDSSGDVEVRLARTDPVAALFIGFAPPAPVGLTIYRKHRSDPEVVPIFIGTVVSASFSGAEATLTCAPVSQSLKRQIPFLNFQSQCPWALYSTGCGAAKASFKDSGTVTAVDGYTVKAAVFATRADGWYANGWLELATAERRFIVGHVGDTVTLSSPFESLAVGQAVDAYAGCDRSETTCLAKFNNLVHFLGFPRIPSRNPYVGGL